MNPYCLGGMGKNLTKPPKPKIKFAAARKIMNKSLKEPGLRESYKANIAMCIYDNRRKDGRLNHTDCNEVAEKLINLIWG